MTVDNHVGNQPFHTIDVFFNGDSSIGNTEAGQIKSIRLSPYLDCNGLEYPANLIELIGQGVPNAERFRRGIALKMIQNTPNPNPIIGKPSSAFIVRTKKSYFLDFLIEDPNHLRDPNRTLHSYMTEYDNLTHSDRYHPANMFNRQSLWSGHVAALTPDFCYLYLFDKFARKSVNLDTTDKFMIRVIHANRIIPITADGHIIDVE